MTQCHNTSLCLRQENGHNDVSCVLDKKKLINNISVNNLIFFKEIRSALCSEVDIIILNIVKSRLAYENPGPCFKMNSCTSYIFSNLYLL